MLTGWGNGFNMVLLLGIETGSKVVAGESGSLDPIRVLGQGVIAGLRSGSIPRKLRAYWKGLPPYVKSLHP